MPRVDNTAFFKQLGELLNSSKTQGSVYLEQKRLTKTGPDSTLHETKSPYPLIFRATNGVPKSQQRISLSTVVEVNDLPNFWQTYSEALKKGTPGLRKKDKKKKKQKN